MTASPSSRRFPNTVLILVFLVTIGAPLLATAFGVDGGDPAVENRQLAAFPRLGASWSAIEGYPSHFTDWFTDHFAFRKHMVRWFGESRYFWLGVSPSQAVAPGKNAFLFFIIDESIDDYANSRPFTDQELFNWRASVTRIRDWCRARGIAYAFTVAPDKYLVYPEEFPDGARKIGPMSRADQLYASISDTQVSVDTRPVLDHAKAAERTYYLTDTHWNDRGAFVAYQAIINAVRAQNPRVPPPWARTDFDAVSREIEGQDLAGMMGLTHVLREDELPLVPKRPRQARVVEPHGFNPRESIGRLVTEIPGSTLPRAIIFRDSFADGLAPFLSEHFSRAVYLWQNDVDPDDILKEHADVVIQEIVSRHLYSFVPSPKLIPPPR